jgi:hypothetical protein
VRDLSTFRGKEANLVPLEPRYTWARTAPSCARQDLELTKIQKQHETSRFLHLFYLVLILCHSEILFGVANATLFFSHHSESGLESRSAPSAEARGVGAWKGSQWILNLYYLAVCELENQKFYKR